MSHSFPTDLIQQIQILTRTESGLSGYDPNDPTLPTLPSISAAVAAFDPSPPHLRCRGCRGPLLRGLESLICVYCGRRQHRSGDGSAPDSISFGSTVGYRWLLQSLRLDGSEKVGPPRDKGEKTEVNRGRSAPKDNICLSELLDLKIGLFTEQEKSEINASTKEPIQGNSSLNYTGVDLDNFFSRPKSDNTSDKQATTSYPIGNEKAQAVATHDGSFQNVQSFQPAVTTSQDNTSDDFSGWEADFKSADSGTQSVSKTIDPVIRSTVDSGSQVGSFEPSNAFAGSANDLSEHMDSIFGSGKNLHESKNGDESVVNHEASNWGSDDLWNNSASDVLHQKEPFGPNVEVKISQQQNGLNTTTTVDWFQNDQWPANVASTPIPNTTNIDEDSFDDWNDFTSSSTVKDPQEKVITRNDNLAGIPLDSLASDNATALSYDDPQWTNAGSAPNLNATDVDEDSFDDWNAFTSSSSVKDPLAKGITQNDNQAGIPLDPLVSDNATACNYDDSQWPTDPGSAPDLNARNVDEDSFDDWNAFTSSSSVKDPLEKAIAQNNNQADFPLDSLVSGNGTALNFDDPLWPTNSGSALDLNARNIDEDSFDDWNAFTSSSSVKDPLGKATTQIDNQAGFPLDSLVSDNATALNYDDPLWPTNSGSAPNLNATNLDADSFDDWNAFTSSSTVKDPLGKEITQNDNQATNQDAMNVGGDIFEDWNDFTASTTVKDPQAKAETQNANLVSGASVKTSELDLFSSNKFGDTGFGSFAHSDLWQNHSLDSTADNKSNLNHSTGKSATDGDDSNASTQSKNDIENLFAQMHDLSFMLESNLSVPPPKSDTHRSPLD